MILTIYVVGPDELYHAVTSAGTSYLPHYRLPLNASKYKSNRAAVTVTVWHSYINVRFVMAKMNDVLIYA